MKVLKKNQLVILVVSLILMTAGYLNFTNEPENKMTAKTVAELGDATLVSSNQIENEVNHVSNTVEEENQVEENNINDNTVTSSNATNNLEENNTVETNKEIETDNYFIRSKFERENIYSQMLETYQEIYNNVNATAEQKKEAIDKITEINNMKNSIMIAENLVAAKGFKDIVIFSNSNSISVIIKAEVLEPEQIAQIQNIISREINVGIETINISTK